MIKKPISCFTVGGSLRNSPRIVYYEGHTYDLDDCSFCLHEAHIDTELPPFVETIPLDFVVRESTASPREDPS